VFSILIHRNHPESNSIIVVGLLVQGVAEFLISPGRAYLCRCSQSIHRRYRRSRDGKLPTALEFDVVDGVFSGSEKRIVCVKAVKNCGLG